MSNWAFFAGNMPALTHTCICAHTHTYAKWVRWSRDDLEESRPLPTLSLWSPDKDNAAWLSSKDTWFTLSATFCSTMRAHTHIQTSCIYALSPPNCNPKAQQEGHRQLTPVAMVSRGWYCSILLFFFLDSIVLYMHEKVYHWHRSLVLETVVHMVTKVPK